MLGDVNSVAYNSQLLLMAIRNKNVCSGILISSSILFFFFFLFFFLLLLLLQKINISRVEFPDRANLREFLVSAHDILFRYSGFCPPIGVKFGVFGYISKNRSVQKVITTIS